MTNDELQFAIDYALDNVIKIEGYIKSPHQPLAPLLPEESMYIFLEGHLKNLIDIQACRAAIETSTCCKDGDKKA